MLFVCFLDTSSGVKVSYMTDTSLHIVYTSVEPSLALIYDSQLGVHSAWRIQKAKIDVSKDVLYISQYTCTCNTLFYFLSVFFINLYFENSFISDVFTVWSKKILCWIDIWDVVLQKMLDCYGALHVTNLGKVHVLHWWLICVKICFAAKLKIKSCPYENAGCVAKVFYLDSLNKLLCQDNDLKHQVCSWF